MGPDLERPAESGNSRPASEPSLLPSQERVSPASRMLHTEGPLEMLQSHRCPRERLAIQPARHAGDACRRMGGAGGPRVAVAGLSAGRPCPRRPRGSVGRAARGADGRARTDWDCWALRRSWSTGGSCCGDVRRECVPHPHGPSRVASIGKCSSRRTPPPATAQVASG